jgi:NAD(P)-dependent dehydrogenase (short-subunit alcohol dehydrogenase family)
MAGVRAIRAAIPVMVANGGGVIVNVGSINGRLPLPMVRTQRIKAGSTILPRRVKEFGRGAFASTRSIPVGRHRPAGRVGWKRAGVAGRSPDEVTPEFIELITASSPDRQSRTSDDAGQRSPPT